MQLVVLTVWVRINIFAETAVQNEQNIYQNISKTLLILIKDKHQSNYSKSSKNVYRREKKNLVSKGNYNLKINLQSTGGYCVCHCDRCRHDQPVDHGLQCSLFSHSFFHFRNLAS